MQRYLLGLNSFNYLIQYQSSREIGRKKKLCSGYTLKEAPIMRLYHTINITDKITI